MSVFKPSTDWAGLPDHIVVSILSYLSIHDRSQSSQVCKAWNLCFESGPLWTRFRFKFDAPFAKGFLIAVKNFGQYMKSVEIELDQSIPVNRIGAADVIKALGELTRTRLRSFKVKFTGSNPYFYAGKEFVDALMVLFGPRNQDCEFINHLTDVDLSGLMVAYDDELFNTMAKNHRHLKNLNIQNRVLICKVTGTCLLRVVQLCRKLEQLHIHNYSLSEDVLLALTEKDRSPLSFLSIKCRREEKYIKDIDDSAWKSVSSYLPKLRVALIFDHTCPFNRVADIMKPNIPVSEIFLETFTYIYDEVRQAGTLYKDTLEKLVLYTPTSRNSPELNGSLLVLAQNCKNLRELLIYCAIEQGTIDAILELHPKMNASKTFRLKSS